VYIANHMSYSGDNQGGIYALDCCLSDIDFNLHVHGCRFFSCERRGALQGGE